MLNINLNNSISIIERFFIERFLELVYKKTIDSYRHRLHNPKSLIKELLDTLNYVKIGKVRYDTHVPNIIKERNRSVIASCIYLAEIIYLWNVGRSVPANMPARVPRAYWPYVPGCDSVHR